MKIIRNRFIPWKGFTAINLFGFVFVRKDETVDEVTLRHEAIHSAQMKRWGYLPFYIIYIGEFIYRLVRHRHWMEAYRNISFEREAFDNQYDKEYLIKCGSKRKKTRQVNKRF